MSVASVVMSPIITDIDFNAITVPLNTALAYPLNSGMFCFSFPFSFLNFPFL